MKKNYLAALSFCLILIPYFAFSFGSDVNITGSPFGKHGAVSKNNGTIYVSVPDSIAPGNYSINIYQSTDTGTTWSLMSALATSYPTPIVKTKMLISGADSMYCIFQTGDSIYTYNFQSNAVVKYAASFGISDFDAIASTNNNALYLFPVEMVSDDLLWTSSLTGGVSWASAGLIDNSVTSSPCVAMYGTTLMVCFYGSQIFSTPYTEIDRLKYTEVTPGNISYTSGGAFGDGSSIMREYCVTMTNNYVWLVFGLGSTANQQAIYVRVSTNGGSSWGGLILISTPTGTNKTYKYIATNSYNSSATNFGCDVTFYSDDTLGSASAANDKMIFVTANNTAPTVFSSPVVFSDFTVTSSPYDPFPIVVEFNGSTSHERGIVWLEDNGLGSGLWYDKFNSTLGVGIEENNLDNNFCIYPNPATDHLLIDLGNNNKKVSISILDISGKVILKTECRKAISLNTKDFIPGFYFVQILSDNNVTQKKFIVE